MAHASIAVYTVTPGVYTNNQALIFSPLCAHGNNTLVSGDTGFQFNVNVYRRFELILNFTASESNTYVRLRNNGSTIIESYSVANGGVILLPWHRLTGAGAGNIHTWTVQTSGSGITVTAGQLGIDFAAMP